MVTMDDWDCASEAKKRPRDKERNCCFCPKHPLPGKILLECGTHPQDAIFEIWRGRVRRRQAFTLDSVIVDTTCLCRPQVKIEFSSIIFFDAEAGRYYGGQVEGESETEPEAASETESEAVSETEVECRCPEKEVEVDLQFELIRICNGVEETVQKWRYLKEIEIKGVRDLEVKISEPFTVTYCDRACPGCCVYKMKVRGRDFDGKFDALRVVTPNISALAQSLCNN